VHQLTGNAFKEPDLVAEKKYDLQKGKIRNSTKKLLPPSLDETKNPARQAQKRHYLQFIQSVLSPGGRHLRPPSPIYPPKF
jgi:hypothetical protein